MRRAGRTPQNEQLGLSTHEKKSDLNHRSSSMNKASLLAQPSSGSRSLALRSSSMQGRKDRQRAWGAPSQLMDCTNVNEGRIWGPDPSGAGPYLQQRVLVLPHLRRGRAEPASDLRALGLEATSLSALLKALYQGALVVVHRYEHSLPQSAAYRFRCTIVAETYCEYGATWSGRGRGTGTHPRASRHCLAGSAAQLH